MSRDSDDRPAATRVARNTVLRAVTDVGGKLTSFAFVVVLARLLSRAQFGDYVAATAISQIVGTLAGFGIDFLQARDIAADRSRLAGFYDYLGLKLAIGATAFALTTAAVALAGGSSRLVALVGLFSINGLLTYSYESANAVFKAYEQVQYYLYASLPSKVLNGGLGIVVLAVGGSVVGAVAANIVGVVIGAALSFWFLYRGFGAPRLAVRVREWPRLARTAFPFGVQEALGQIVFRIDTVLLTLLATTVVVSYYGASYRLLESTLFIAWSVGASVLPMFSYLQRTSRPSLDRAYEGALKFVTVVILPASIALFICAKPIVGLVYGLPRYATAVPVVRWLAFAIVAYSIGHISAILVVARRHGRVTLASTAAVAVFNIVTNVILIPLEGAVGAAQATLATELLLAVILVVLARTEAGTPNWSYVLGSAAVAGAAMAGAMIPLTGSLAAALVVGVTVYVVVLVAVEALRGGGDLVAARTVFQRRRGGRQLVVDESATPASSA